MVSSCDWAGGEAGFVLKNERLSKDNSSLVTRYKLLPKMVDNIEEVCTSVCNLNGETSELVGIVSDDSNDAPERLSEIQDAYLASRLANKKWKDLANKSKADYEKIV